MTYKPDESTLIAYLYGELAADEQQRVEQYLAAHPEIRVQLEELGFVRKALTHIPDKEVIAPPIVLDDGEKQRFWNTSSGRTILAIAASLMLIMLVGKLTDLRIEAFNNALTIRFGEPSPQPQAESLTHTDVQQMINSSLVKNNESMQQGWEETQRELDESVRRNVAARTDAAFASLTQKVSNASQTQIRDFVATLQADNARMISSYLQMNSTDQRKYMQELLVDFAKYLEQQHRNDLQVLQARLQSLEQDNNAFKYETEQLLTSIIGSVGPTKTNEIKY